MPEVKKLKGSRHFGLNPDSRLRRKLRVAAYCRVSTDGDEQLESYKSQVKYYTELIKSNPDWEFVDIYADAAISGTKTDLRDGFNRMIEDAKHGKMDYILTKSISRFSRNTIDVLKYVRLLLDNKVAINFEEEKIDTMNMDGELILSVMSAVYQQEVENTSAHVKKGLRMKMERGEMVGFQGCLGYDYDKKTKSIHINPEEAETVRLIYKLYLQGYGCGYIRRQLESLGRKTKDGGTHWTDSGVLFILKNEKYKGDLLMGKTYTVSPISKRRVRNDGVEDMYMIHDHHEAIISATEFDKAQEIRLNRAKKMQGEAITGNHVRLNTTYTFSGMLECGFCGATLARKMWPGALGKPKKVRWYCVKAYKSGRATCPHCKAIPEEAIKQAFVDSFNMCLGRNKEMVDELLECIEQELSDDTTTIDQRALSRKISNLEKRISDLLDLKLDGNVDEDAYNRKYSELYKQLNELKEQREKAQIAGSKKESKHLRLKKFQELLTSKDKIDEFDDAVFKTIVDKVIIGEMGDDGIPEPWKIIFIYKTNISDTKDAGAYKEKRKRRTKEQITKVKKMISENFNAILKCRNDESNHGFSLQPLRVFTCRMCDVATTEKIVKLFGMRENTPEEMLRRIQ